ncbi:hypothetical protein RCL1_006933 [Eukaryota sp. TZLM3-RCL]
MSNHFVCWFLQLLIIEDQASLGRVLPPSIYPYEAVLPWAVQEDSEQHSIPQVVPPILNSVVETPDALQTTEEKKKSLLSKKCVFSCVALAITAILLLSANDSGLRFCFFDDLTSERVHLDCDTIITDNEEYEHFYSYDNIRKGCCHFSGIVKGTYYLRVITPNHHAHESTFRVRSWFSRRYKVKLFREVNWFHLFIRDAHSGEYFSPFGIAAAVAVTPEESSISSVSRSTMYGAIALELHSSPLTYRITVSHPKYKTLHIDTIVNRLDLSLSIALEPNGFQFHILDPRFASSLMNALITVERPGYFTTRSTDSRGLALFHDIPNGNYDVTLSRSGFLTRRATMSVNNPEGLVKSSIFLPPAVTNNDWVVVFKRTSPNIRGQIKTNSDCIATGLWDCSDVEVWTANFGEYYQTFVIKGASYGLFGTGAYRFRAELTSGHTSAWLNAEVWFFRASGDGQYYGSFSASPRYYCIVDLKRTSSTPLPTHTSCW